MTPKVTALMAKKALKDGAEVKTKPNIKRPDQRPPPPMTPIPGPEPQNAGTERHTRVLEASITQQLIIAQKQTEELTRLIKLLAAEKPIRLKVHRNMDRESPAYLLMEYIDVIPATYTRKLDS